MDKSIKTNRQKHLKTMAPTKYQSVKQKGTKYISKLKKSKWAKPISTKRGSRLCQKVSKSDCASVHQ